LPLVPPFDFFTSLFGFERRAPRWTPPAISRDAPLIDGRCCLCSFDAFSISSFLLPDLPEQDERVPCGVCPLHWGFFFFSFCVFARYVADGRCFVFSLPFLLFFLCNCGRRRHLDPKLPPFLLAFFVVSLQLEVFQGCIGSNFDCLCPFFLFRWSRLDLKRKLCVRALQGPSFFVSPHFFLEASLQERREAGSGFGVCTFLKLLP